MNADSGLRQSRRHERMNCSNPNGPSVGQRTSGEVPTWFAKRAPPPPALSLGKRENPPLPFSTTQRGVCPTNFPNNRNCRRLFPLPVGEGQGEGNRLALRQSDSDPSWNCRASRLLRQSRRFPMTMKRPEMFTREASRALAQSPSAGISKSVASVTEADLRGWVERLAVPRHFELEQEENKNTALWIAAQLQGWRCHGAPRGPRGTAG